MFDHDAPLSSLWHGGPAPYYFPDLAIQWAMFALGASVALVLCLYPLAQAAISAVGWILLCDRLYGKSPVRRAVVLALHALPFLFLAWDNADIFYSQMMGTFHHGLIAALPWLLWLSILVLNPAPNRKQSAAFPVKPAVALVVLLTLLSDLLVVPQFVAPVGLCALILARRGKLSSRRVWMFFGLIAAGIVGGLIFKQLPGLRSLPPIPHDFSLQSLLQALRLQVAHFGNAALRNPLAAAAWLAFAVIGTWRALAVLRPNARRNIPAFMAVPSGAEHSLAALFVPAAVSATFLAPIAVGAVFAKYAHGDFSYMRPVQNNFGVVFAVRHSLPVIFLPLFAGWALLPGGVPKIRGRAGGWALAACAALAVFSAPKAARIDFEALDPFATPLQKCFAEHATRLGLRGGIMTYSMESLPLLHPGAEVERLLRVGVFRRSAPGESFMVVEQSYTHRALSGEFDFVLANLYNGRYFHHPPLTGETGCKVDDQAACLRPVNNYDLDPASARAAFGEPKEEINCAGVGLLYYDPPLKFDFSHLDDPYLAPVVRW